MARVVKKNISIAYMVPSDESELLTRGASNERIGICTCTRRQFNGEVKNICVINAEVSLQKGHALYRCLGHHRIEHLYQ